MELIGRFGVDSGQAIIGDPCYLRQWKDEMEDGGEFDSQLVAPFPYTYNGASSATCSKSKGGTLGRGLAVAVETGYGDGEYPVYVKRDGSNRIVQVIIDFSDELTDTDSDDDDEDSDY